jgi:predicted flap endonuclease-1-like 5' DNA nuclease
MIAWLSICDLSGWPFLLLWWLLPFILGLALGWILWSSYKRRWEECQRTIQFQETQWAPLRQELEECREQRAALKNEVALLKADLAERGTAGGFGLVKDKPDILNIGPYGKLDPGNLQILEGIGPKMEGVLQNAGIRTWSDLAGQTPGRLKDLLDGFGGKYRIIDPATWPEQASLASQGRWEDLVARQRSLGSGGLEVDQVTEAKVDKMLVKLGIVKKFKQDDLKAIEGIGPKIEGLLHKGGIKTWSDLAAAETTSLKAILDDAGTRYQMADPTTWPEQAALARDGRWNDLKEFQDLLNGGRST